METDAAGRRWLTEAMRGCGGHGRTAWGEFVFAAGAPVFAGHFPGNPVLPAVVQMALVRFVTERRLGCALVPVSQERSRFTGMVTPERLLRVEVELDDDRAGVGAGFVLSCDGEQVARGRVVYARRTAGEQTP